MKEGDTLRIVPGISVNGIELDSFAKDIDWVKASAVFGHKPPSVDIHIDGIPFGSTLDITLKRKSDSR